MQLKRLYDEQAPKKQWGTRLDPCRGCDRGKVVNAARDGVEDCPLCNGTGKMEVLVPPVVGVRILRAGRVQRFTQNLINGGLQEGWLGMAGGRITITAEPENLTYRIVRVPGAYCCHCDAPVPGGLTVALAAESLAHVAQVHPGDESPDPHNPAGYRVESCYGTVLEVGKPIELPAAAKMDRAIRDELAARAGQKYGAQVIGPGALARRKKEKTPASTGPGGSSNG